MFDIDNAKSYATEENLDKALAKIGLDKAHGLVVCNRAGRFTAIFTVGRCEVAEVPMMLPAHNGFMIVN